MNAQVGAPKDPMDTYDKHNPAPVAIDAGSVPPIAPLGVNTQPYQDAAYWGLCLVLQGIFNDPKIAYILCFCIIVSKVGVNGTAHNLGVPVKTAIMRSIGLDYSYWPYYLGLYYQIYPTAQPGNAVFAQNQWNIIDVGYLVQRALELRILGGAPATIAAIQNLVEAANRTIVVACRTATSAQGTPRKRQYDVAEGIKVGTATQVMTNMGRAKEPFTPVANSKRPRKSH